jgi:hypothetical protein
MRNQVTFLGFKLTVLFTCLTLTLQACAGGYGNSAPAADADKILPTPAANTTQTLFKVLTLGTPAYNIDGKQNPELTLKRGLTYTFELKTTGHPFWIKTKNSTGKANAYKVGVTGNGTERGTLTFAVPKDAPATLHYNCEVHEMMNNVINIID